MGRRKKSSPLEDVIDLLSMLPWWVCVGLAAAGYVWLHRYAASALPAPGGVQGTLGGAATGALMQRAILQGLASAGQYIVPLVCLMAAAISAWRRRQRRALAKDAAQAESAHALDGMNWQEFELLVGEAYRMQGYRVTELGGSGADGGVDIVLTKGAEKFLVQCKHWRAYKVGVAVVRELFGVMAATGATGGFVVTSGRFTADAKAFAQGRNISLVEGPQLLDMIRSAQQARGMRPPTPQPSLPQPPASPSQAKELSQVTAKPLAAEHPECPRCGSPMELRTARRGAHAGADFWGCSTYPVCRGTRAAR